jgi:hypothetical protein
VTSGSNPHILGHYGGQDRTFKRAGLPEKHSCEFTAVLPHAGTRLVPENFCFIPEQIVLKKEQIVYRFYRLDSGTIALFRKRFDIKFEAI